MKNLWCTYIDSLTERESRDLCFRDAMHALCDEIDRRLAALGQTPDPTATIEKSQIDRIIHMFDLQNNWNDSQRIVSERHTSLLYSLEQKIKALEGTFDAIRAADAALIPVQPPEAKPDGREWMHKYWIAWKDMGGNWNVDLSKDTFAMPYDPNKPEPPEPPVDKRGA